MLDENPVKLVPVTFLFENDDGRILDGSSDNAPEIAELENWISEVFHVAPKRMPITHVLKDIECSMYDKLSFLLDGDESRFVHVTPDYDDGEFSVCVGVFKEREAIAAC